MIRLTEIELLRETCMLGIQCLLFFFLNNFFQFFLHRSRDVAAIAPLAIGVWDPSGLLQEQLLI
jgi:hypothetical protein